MKMEKTMEPEPKVNLLNFLTKDLPLPDECNRWAIKSVHPDLRTRNGYRWAFPGNWTYADGEMNLANTTGCPRYKGDGICLAHNWKGMSQGGIPAITLLLTAYHTDDVGGGDTNKIRVSRAYVVDVIDGARLIREHGDSANLQWADLDRANLQNANLQWADLDRANLYGADLDRANLHGAIR
jgi:uncharacterized protein YjbI with pentapeptide repeats